MGRTINKIATAQKNTSEEYRAEKVMCVIITDGEENSSREFSLEKVKQLVEQHKEKANWEFVFLGANMDAIQTAGYFGISADRAQSFHADKEGVALNFAVMSESVAEFRRSGKVADNWKERIESDFKRRGGK
jgi:3-methyladenine DNA glycosylase AlkD